MRPTRTSAESRPTIRSFESRAEWPHPYRLRRGRRQGCSKCRSHTSTAPRSPNRPPASRSPRWGGPDRRAIVQKDYSMSLAGTWGVVSSPDFDDEYLSMEAAPQIRLRLEGDRVVGDYHLGLQVGDLHGRVEDDDRAVLSFEGTDEMDDVSGAAMATLKGERLIFKLMYHHGDDYTFECERRG